MDASQPLPPRPNSALLRSWKRALSTERRRDAAALTDTRARVIGAGQWLDRAKSGWPKPIYDALDARVRNVVRSIERDPAWLMDAVDPARLAGENAAHEHHP